MTKYETFSENQVIDYVCQLGYFKDTQPLSCTQLDVCKLHHVFQVTDIHKNSVFVKQAILFADESSALTRDRTRIEAEVLINHFQHCPEYTVNVLHYDISMACLIMQDLTDYDMLRNRLVDAKYVSHVGKQVAHYLAHTLFYTSDLYLSGIEKKANVIQFINPELCQITEDLCFTTPYQEDDQNTVSPANLNLVLTLREDNDLKAEVAELKGKFLNTTQALLHGNLNTGNILVNNKEIKLIDAKFGFYGPIGFDLGSILGNFLINFCTSAVSLESYQKAEHLDALIQIVRDTWNHFADLFSQLMANNTHDIALQNETYQARYLRGIFLDSIGFAGCELIRRTLGVPSVTDITRLMNDTKRTLAEQHTIQLGIILIKKRYQFVSINDVLLEAESIIEQGSVDNLV